MIRDGEAGAEKAWLWLYTVFAASEEARRGSEEVLPVLVLTDRFFMFRGLLYGDSHRSEPEWRGEPLAGKPARYILSAPDFGWVNIEELNDEIGRRSPGDSGDELGEGSVRVESTVEIVVVGEDSVESDGSVVLESRRHTSGLVHRDWL